MPSAKADEIMRAQQGLLLLEVEVVAVAVVVAVVVDEE